MATALRLKLARSSIRPFCYGLGTVIGFWLFIFALPMVLGRGLDMVPTFSALFTTFALMIALPALPLAAALLFLGGHHVLKHPVLFATLATACGLVPLAVASGFQPATFGIALLALPGLVVGFVMLADRLDRMSREARP
jgi:hypothetical protein